MSPEPRDTDWEVLGLRPGADADEVHRAYHRRRALYRKDSLATYSLLEESELQTTVDRVEAAYRRIVDHLTAQKVMVRDEVRPETAPPPQDLGPPPPLADGPGPYLRHHRLALGLTLERIADETKIRKALLAALESEDFDHLPARVYVRGFAMQVARLLHLDEPETIAQAFLDRMEPE
jgi:flagellar biosynthesis protein FlhG